jgi:hypothetical protein
MRRIPPPDPLRRLPLAVPLVLVLGGCVGDLTGPAGSSTPRPGDPATGVDPDAPGDVDRMNDNPELFEIAARYFPGQESQGGPARLFRLTRHQLDLTTATLLPQHVQATALETLPRDPLQTNYEYADNLRVSPANFTPYTTWVAQIAARVKEAPETVIDCAGGTDATCLDDKARLFVQRAFRGVVSEGRLDRYATFLVDSVAQVGFAQATAEFVELVLTAPNYVFRDETAAGTDGALSHPQALQNLTYTLADAPPEALGLSSLAAEQHVGSPERLRETVNAVLESPEARAKLLRYFKAWLEIKEPDEFTIASSVFPEFTPDVASAVVAETDAFLERQLGQATPRLKDLTESTRSWVLPEAAFLYGLSEPGADGVELDPLERLGIFTQPAVIASHSGPTTTRLVKRGVFFVRKVMCMELGEPPEGTDTTLYDDAGKTERERVENLTADAPCSACHAAINPFGFMQESYDAIGRFRTTDENGQRVDTSLDVSFLDEGNLKTVTSVEALRGFTRSYRFQQCFTRQLFRFFSGREETRGDHPTLRRMFFDFANGEKQDIVGLLQQLASSATFSQRTEAP